MARQLGKAYLEKHPQARLLSLTQQLTQHWSDADFFGARSVHRLHTQLARQIDKDYRKQRLFILGPAIFSETEAQLAALAVMAG